MPLPQKTVWVVPQITLWQKEVQGQSRRMSYAVEGPSGKDQVWNCSVWRKEKYMMGHTDTKDTRLPFSVRAEHRAFSTVLRSIPPHCGSCADRQLPVPDFRPPFFTSIHWKRQRWVPRYTWYATWNKGEGKKKILSAFPMGFGVGTHPKMACAGPECVSSTACGREGHCAVSGISWGRFSAVVSLSLMLHWKKQAADLSFWWWMSPSLCRESRSSSGQSALPGTRWERCLWHLYRRGS